MPKRGPEPIPGSISVSTRACHARKRGSTPRQGAQLFCMRLEVHARLPYHPRFVQPILQYIGCSDHLVLITVLNVVATSCNGLT